MQEILSFAFLLPEKRLNRYTKLIAILRRQFCIILTALEENIFSVLGSVASRLRPRRNILSSNHRQPKLAVCVLGDFIDSLNIINEQVEMKTQIKKRVNKTLLTFYLLLLDVY